MRFVDLFAGMGGFHRALSELGHECVFACELDDELRSVYSKNFPEAAGFTFGDVRTSRSKIPEHDILCAGFPCQPFSKSGEQRGFEDLTRGTLFHEILEVVRTHEPSVILLENVGNFARHDSGRTWEVVRSSLEDLGYSVRGSEPKVSGGHGLISPHHFGFPHHRERFFAVATQWELPEDPFPPSDESEGQNLADLVLSRGELDEDEVRETALSTSQVACIEAWNEFLRLIPETERLPSFPLWGDEIDATYPFEKETPHSTPARFLGPMLGLTNGEVPNKQDLLDSLPSYARVRQRRFPGWKRRFIAQNREWFTSQGRHLSREWKARLRGMPPSFRKLEWNCQGEERDLWAHVLQFRPSGLRVKRFHSIPALVAMTTTQIPVLGPQRRYLSRREALLLQGFPVDFKLPAGKQAAFRALGNAVHVGVVKRVLREVIDRRRDGSVVDTTQQSGGVGSKVREKA